MWSSKSWKFLAVSFLSLLLFPALTQATEDVESCAYFGARKRGETSAAPAAMQVETEIGRKAAECPH